MGTINYKTSDYITLGIKPYDKDDFIKNNDPISALEIIEEAAVNGYSSIDDYIYELIECYYDDDRTNAESYMRNYNFEYFSVSIDYGYYEGLYIDLSEEFPLFIDEDERPDIISEVDDLKKLLSDLAGCGFVACFPGWCTGYSDYNGTMEEIETACNALKEKAETIKTWDTVEV